MSIAQPKPRSAHSSSRRNSCHVSMTTFFDAFSADLRAAYPTDDGAKLLDFIVGGRLTGDEQSTEEKLHALWTAANNFRQDAVYSSPQLEKKIDWNGFEAAVSGLNGTDIRAFAAAQAEVLGTDIVKIVRYPDVVCTFVKPKASTPRAVLGG